MASKIDSRGLAVISEERTSARKHHDNSDDLENLYTHKIKNPYGSNKKKLHPLMMGPNRQSPGKMISLHMASKNNLSEFTQRIMSAKLLRTKQVQNQLNETQNQLNELINENRVLRNLLKRQEGALKKYEGNHAELPQLIRSHNEEIRTLKASNKIIKAQLKESNTKLKERENELETIRDNYNKLKKLSTEKNLLEREKLQKKVDELQEVVKEQEEKIQVLSRKVLLESKNYRHHLNVEIMKHKETQKDLNSALSMINKLERELMLREKMVPPGKTLFKRESKNLMPSIINKSTGLQPKMGVPEDNFLTPEEAFRKSVMGESPEPELEVLNGLGSSDDTSPMQDILPEINVSRKPTAELETTTEITTYKSELFRTNFDLPKVSLNSIKNKKSSIANPKFSNDPETNARMIAEKLSEDMAAIDSIVKKVDGGSNLEKEEDSEETSKPKSSTEEEEESVGVKRYVPKRKLHEESGESDKSADVGLDLSEKQKQKLEQLTRSRNEIKTEIYNERKKAEEKIKELKEINGSESDWEETEKKDSTPEMETAKELRFVNFTDDAYILKELEKTDKIFNRLKNETQKKDKKKEQKPKPQPKQQNVTSFRTESRREPEYLKEFQSEYQKQNLLKALKAIDVGKDPNLSSEESDGDKPKQTFYQKNGLKHVQKLSSGSDKDLMEELFGPKRNESMKLEYGTITSINE